MQHSGSGTAFYVVQCQIVPIAKAQHCSLVLLVRPPSHTYYLTAVQPRGSTAMTNSASLFFELPGYPSGPMFANESVVKKWGRGSRNLADRIKKRGKAKARREELSNKLITRSAL